MIITPLPNIEQSDSTSVLSIVLFYKEQYETVLAENSNLREQLAECHEQIDEMLERVDRAKASRSKLEQQQDHAGRLRSNKHLSGNQKHILSYVVERIRKNAIDERSLTRFDLHDIQEHTGISQWTISKELKRLETYGAIGRYDEYVEKTKKGRKVDVDHIWLELRDILVQSPEDIVAPGENGRNNGGKRERCPICHSENVQRIYHTRCNDCGHEDIRYPLTQEQQEQLTDLDEALTTALPELPEMCPTKEKHNAFDLQPQLPEQTALENETSTDEKHYAFETQTNDEDLAAEIFTEESTDEKHNAFGCTCCDDIPEKPEGTCWHCQAINAYEWNHLHQYWYCQWCYTPITKAKCSQTKAVCVS
jgi:DNA-binding MarR family transcriptional regulator